MNAVRELNTEEVDMVSGAGAIDSALTDIINSTGNLANQVIITETGWGNTLTDTVSNTVQSVGKDISEIL